MKRLTTRTMLSAGLALALAAGVPGAAAAAQGEGPGRGQGPRMMRPGGPGGPGMRGPGLNLPLGRLDLSEAQREQVRGVAGTHAASFRAIGERARAARRALNEAISGEAFDEATIRQRAADLAAVDADAAVLRARVHQEMFALLTPEQQQKARDLRAEVDKRRQERGEGRQQGRIR